MRVQFNAAMGSIGIVLAAASFLLAGLVQQPELSLLALLFMMVATTGFLAAFLGRFALRRKRRGR